MDVDENALRLNLVSAVPLPRRYFPDQVSRPGLSVFKKNGITVARQHPESHGNFL